MTEQIAMKHGLKWLFWGLLITVIQVNIFVLGTFVQSLLSFAMLYYSVRFFKQRTNIPFYLAILVVLSLLNNNLAMMGSSSFNWIVLLGSIVHVLLISEFGKILASIEQKLSANDFTARIISRYVKVHLVVLFIFTFMMNLNSDIQLVILTFGTVMLVSMKIMLIMHIHNLRKHLKMRMTSSIYNKK
ncbi:MAG: hypothetical protein RR595_04205 [Lysinibacillus sp.]